jgi:hypothetical protein
MKGSVIGRRDVLRGAGVVAAGATIGTLGIASPALATEDRGNNLSGSWLITRQDKGSPTTTKAVLSLALGDVIVVHDIQPAGPPFTGTWRNAGPGFRATFWTGSTGEAPGEPGPTIRVRITSGRVTRGMISGSYVFDVFLPDGTLAPDQSGSGTFTGNRIIA